MSPCPTILFRVSSNSIFVNFFLCHLCVNWVFIRKWNFLSCWNFYWVSVSWVSCHVLPSHRSQTCAKSLGHWNSNSIVCLIAYFQYFFCPWMFLFIFVLFLVWYRQKWYWKGRTCYFFSLSFKTFFTVLCWFLYIFQTLFEFFIVLCQFAARAKTTLFLF